MAVKTKSSSLRDGVIDSIGNFLYEEKFTSDEITKLGILEIINLVSDYHEEGKALFPEIIVTKNFDLFKTIPKKVITIAIVNLSVKEFKNAIKLCAPLAINSWIIFIEVSKDCIKYGISSAEISETSPSFYSQIIADQLDGATIAYIRNIGQKTVELVGIRNKLIVSLNLEQPKEYSNNEIKELCKCIASETAENFRSMITTFFEKIIDDAIKNGHGNLIGVVNDDETSISNLKMTIPNNGGIYLLEPIDFEGLIIDSEDQRSNEASINLTSHSSVLKAMLNHDGITIVTNKGKVIAYHILIGDFINSESILEGGARSKAFESMKNCNLFNFCFYKSQDGNIKIWEKK